MASPFFYKRGQFFNALVVLPNSSRFRSAVLYIRRSEADSSVFSAQSLIDYHEVKKLEATIDNRYTLPDLPYDYTALEPHYSARLLELHHDKHSAAYVAGANTTLEKLAEAREKCDFAAINQSRKNLAFHLSGHVLHSLFWRDVGPRGGGEATGNWLRPSKNRSAQWPISRASSTRRRSTSKARAGARRLGAARQAARDRAGVRPPRQHRQRHRAASRARHVGACLLSAIPERERGMGEGLLEDRQLGDVRQRLQKVRTLDLGL